MQLSIVLVSLLAFVLSLVAAALAVHNAFRMILHVRPASHSWVNLVPFVAFALPNALTEQGVLFRRRFSKWLAVAIALVGVALAARFLAERLST